MNLVFFYNSIFSRNNFPKIEDGAYVINRSHKNSKRTHCISLFFDKNMAVYFDSFGTEYILQKIKSEINHLLIKYLEYKVMNLLCVDFILSFS